MSNLFRKSLIVLGLILSCLTTVSYASNTAIGGVSLGVTRVIYPIDAKQVSLPVINHSKNDRYLINSWIETDYQKKSKDFLITPPLFVAEANTENTLRIVNVANNLPFDRESVFWVNVKSIPSVNKEDLESKNLLQLAVLSRIKLFVRPNDLPYKSEKALEMISFEKGSNGIVVDNKSPYFISFVNVYIGDKKQPNVMAAPFEKTTISSVFGKNFSYQTVNDFGGLTPKTEINLH
ncbi:molecular chaperone [Acinetobacter sp. Ac_877]|uniref:fimbria/pilus periplasmic chaperone n=1 Tax=Acinetobacter portensis TaxID=1839785 RepID=UPI00128E7A4C|nr:fimbria/pilus periplasmic chaperone [Acinetobacter portensis]MPW40170.1 molecular chaperone [Acinetobacter portensis]